MASPEASERSQTPIDAVANEGLAAASIADDYNLSKPITSQTGLRSGLTSYGDAHFSLFLRKVFIKALGYCESLHLAS